MPTSPNPSYLQGLRIDPASPVPALHQALEIALYDEYHARATYQKVIDTFGALLPFSNIVQAEERHINALLPLFSRYGATPPQDDWYGKVEIAPTPVENCEIGVAAEIDNIRMYDHLLSYVAEPDVRDIFYRLQAASYNNHLPAFRQCVANHYGTGASAGQTNSQEDIMKSVTDLLSGKGDVSGLISRLTGSVDAKLLTGAAAGAALMWLVSSGSLQGFSPFDPSQTNEGE